MNLYKENLNQKWSENDSFTVERYIQFSTFLQDNKTILDVGCNTGRGGSILKSIFPNLQIIGLEIIKERIKKIPDGVYEKVINESIVNWNSGELKFDYILAGEVIEHIPEKEFEALLVNCKKILKCDGKILFTTPNPNSFLVKLGRNSVFNDPSHVNIMSIQKFTKKVNESGLVVCKIIGSGKMTRYLPNFSCLNLYGSYLAILKK